MKKDKSFHTFLRFFSALRGEHKRRQAMTAAVTAAVAVGDAAVVAASFFVVMPHRSITGPERLCHLAANLPVALAT